MAGSTYRDLVVRIVGDAKGMTKATKEAETGLKGFENRLGGVRSALAGAFAGGAILAFAKQSMQAALEDARAQERLAKTLENVVGANKDQVAGVEKSIASMEKQFAVADDQLRPAFETLVRATKDVGQAQSLMQLALDVSAGSGKGLQEVTVALVKAMGGQMRGLKELGINVKTAAGDTADFADVQAQLVAMFGGQAAAAADSQAGRLAALGIQYENLKESVGTALLPVLMQLADIANSLFGWFNGLSEGTQHLIAQVVVFGTVAVGAVKAFTAIKAAVIAMNIAMAASPIGLIAAGIGALAAAYALFSGSSEEAAHETEDVARAARDLGIASDDTARLLDALRQSNKGAAFTGAQWADIVTAVTSLGLGAEATAVLLGNLRDGGKLATDGMKKFGPEAYKAAEDLQVLVDVSDDAPEAIENTNKSIYKGTEALKRAGAPTAEQTRKLAEMGRVQKQAGIEAERMAKRITDAALKVRETFDNTRNLTRATKDYKDALKDLASKLKDAKGNAVDQTIAYQDTVDTMLTLAETAATTLGASLDEAGRQNILIQTLSDIRSGVSDPVMQAMLDALISKLQILSGLTFNSSFDPSTDIKMRYDEKKKRWVPGRAAGGPVSAGGTYVVGERGPELLTMGSSGGVITPNHALGGGGNTFVVNVAAPDGKDPYAFGQAIVKAIKAFERTNGKVFQAA